MDIANEGGNVGRARREILEAEHLIPNKGSQLKTIVEELYSDALSTAQADEISELVHNIRFAYHRERSATTKVQALDFTESSSEFLGNIEDAPDDESSELIRSYGLVWVHESPLVCLASGERSSEIAKHHLNYPVESIEQIAAAYLRSPYMQSSTLEWALINSLLYAETRAFIETLGQTLVGSVGIGHTSRASIWRALGASVGSVVLEGVKLVATGAASMMVGEGDRAASVLLFVSITAARWIYRARGQKQKQKIVQLADVMIGVHQLAKNQHFNAGVVRHAAYAATEQGAVFSDYVYHLLDRRIRDACSK